MVAPTVLVMVPLLGLATACGANTTQTPKRESTPGTAPATIDQEAAQVAQIVECLQQRGWDVKLSQPGSTSYDVKRNSNQDSQFAEDQVACDKEAGWVQNPPMSEWIDAQWAQAYAFQRETADCLRGQGYEIPDIPSFQKWQDTFPTEDAWTAYEFVPNVDEQEWNRLNQACPPPRDPE